MSRLTPTDQSLWEQYASDVKPLSTEAIAPIPKPSVLTVQGRRAGQQLDLHGMTLAEAHKAVRGFLADARSQHKFVTVITGQDGEISREFRHWLDGDKTIARTETLNGGGAYRIHFRKK